MVLKMFKNPVLLIKLNKLLSTCFIYFLTENGENLKQKGFMHFCPPTGIYIFFNASLAISGYQKIPQFILNLFLQFLFSHNLFDELMSLIKTMYNYLLKLWVTEMLNNVQLQLLKPLTLKKPQNSAEPLWKRVQPYTIKQQNQSTQKSFNTAQRSQSQIVDSISAQNRVQQTNINHFLLKMHHKISQSAYGSQSEIMEKLSLDWEEEKPYQIMGGSVAKKFTLNDSNAPLFLTPRTEKALNIPTTLQSLKYIKSLQVFLNYIESINPKLHTELSKIIEDNTKLNQECISLKYKQSKAQIKIKMLDNQIEILERKNNQLIGDFQKLRNQVQKQIQFQEDKYKYKYQKIIQQMKEDFQRKTQEFQKKMQTSTCNTKSITFSQTKESDCKDVFYHGENGAKAEAAKKKGQLVRSNRKSSFKQENNEQKTKEASIKFAKQYKRQSQYDFLIGQIIRPFATKSLLLANSNSN